MNKPFKKEKIIDTLNLHGTKMEDMINDPMGNLWYWLFSVYLIVNSGFLLVSMVYMIFRELF